VEKRVNPLFLSTFRLALGALALGLIPGNPVLEKHLLLSIDRFYSLRDKQKLAQGENRSNSKSRAHLCLSCQRYQNQGQGKGLMDVKGFKFILIFV